MYSYNVLPEWRTTAWLTHSSQWHKIIKHNEFKIVTSTEKSLNILHNVQSLILTIHSRVPKWLNQNLLSRDREVVLLETTLKLLLYTQLHTFTKQYMLTFHHHGTIGRLVKLNYKSTAVQRNQVNGNQHITFVQGTNSSVTIAAGLRK